MKKYRHFTEEFKRGLIAQIDNGEISKAAASREHNLASSLLDRWQQQIHEGRMTSRPSAREQQLERELDQYKKKVGELAVQNELLKKLNATYTYTKRLNGYVVTGGNTDPSKRGAK
jgi:transposase-like protein